MVTIRLVFAFIFVLGGLSACASHNILGAVAGIGYGAYQAHRAMKEAERDMAIERCAPENRVPSDDEWCKGRLHR